MIFKSGSKSLLKERLKSRNPLKTDSAINKKADVTTMPTAAMIVMILIALLLLKLNR